MSAADHPLAVASIRHDISGVATTNMSQLENTSPLSSQFTLTGKNQGVSIPAIGQASFYSFSNQQQLQQQRSGSEMSPLTFSRAESFSNIQFLRSRTSSASPLAEAARERKREVLNSLHEKLKDDLTEKSEELSQRHQSPKERFQSLVKTVINNENPQIKSLKIALEAKEEEILKLKRTEEGSRRDLSSMKHSSVELEHENASKSREIEHLKHELETIKSMQTGFEAAIGKLRKTNEFLSKSRLDVLTLIGEAAARKAILEAEHEVRSIFSLLKHSDNSKRIWEEKYRAIQRESETERDAFRRDRLVWEQRERQLRAQIILQADAKEVAETAAAEATASLSNAKAQLTAVSAQYGALKTSHEELLQMIESNRRGRPVPRSTSVGSEFGVGGSSPLPKRTWYPSGVPKTNYHEPKEPVSVLRECACCPEGRHVLTAEGSGVPIYTNVSSKAASHTKIQRGISQTIVSLAPTSTVSDRYYDDRQAEAVTADSTTSPQHTIVIAAAPRAVTPVRVRQRHPLRSSFTDATGATTPRSSSVSSRTSAGAGGNYAVVIKASSPSNRRADTGINIDLVPIVTPSAHARIQQGLSPYRTNESARTNSPTAFRPKIASSEDNSSAVANRKAALLMEKITNVWNKSFNPAMPQGRFTTSLNSPTHDVASKRQNVLAASSTSRTHSPLLSQRVVPPLTTTQNTRIISTGPSPHRATRPDEGQRQSPQRSVLQTHQHSKAPTPLLNLKVPTLLPVKSSNSHQPNGLQVSIVQSRMDEQRSELFGGDANLPEKVLVQDQTSLSHSSVIENNDSVEVKHETFPHGSTPEGMPNNHEHEGSFQATNISLASPPASFRDISPRASTPRRHFTSTETARSLQLLMETELAELNK